MAGLVFRYCAVSSYTTNSILSITIEILKI